MSTKVIEFVARTIRLRGGTGGESLAITIPARLVKEAGLERHTFVKVRIEVIMKPRVVEE